MDEKVLNQREHAGPSLLELKYEALLRESARLKLENRRLKDVIQAEQAVPKDLSRAYYQEEKYIFYEKLLQLQEEMGGYFEELDELSASSLKGFAESKKKINKKLEEAGQ